LRLLQFLLTALVMTSYEGFLESSKWQATLGKKWMGLKVYNSEGSRLTLMQAATRSIVKEGPFLLFAFSPFGQILNILWLVCHIIVVQVSPVSQAIHDKAVGSWVAAQESTIQLRLT
jgi:uncharacterized RDD family membrane protein YckC